MAIGEKYIALTSWLQRTYKDSALLSFEELSQIIDIPKYAYNNRSAWANSKKPSSLASSWLNAGYVVAGASICDRWVLFKKGTSEDCASSNVVELEDGRITKYNGDGGEIAIPNGARSISFGAFENDIFTAVVIPRSIEEITPLAFSGLHKLERVIVSEGVTTIGVGAFRGCTTLNRVTLPRTLTFISWLAFEGCTSLTEIHYRGTDKEWEQITKSDGWGEGERKIKIICK